MFGSPGQSPAGACAVVGAAVVDVDVVVLAAGQLLAGRCNTVPGNNGPSIVHGFAASKARNCAVTFCGQRRRATDHMSSP